MAKTYSGTAQQQLRDAIAAINAGGAKVEGALVGGGDEGGGSWQNVLVSKDGTIFTDVIAKDLGNGQFRLETSAPAEAGDNTRVVINTQLDPATGAFTPVTSQNQVNIEAIPRSGGGGFFDRVIDSTLGRTLNFIDGDPLKAAALFYGGAALAPQIGAAGAAEAAGAGGALGSTGTGLTATGTTGLTGAGTSAYGGLGANLGAAEAAGGLGGSAIGGAGLTGGGGAAYGGLGANLGTAGMAAGTGSLLSGAAGAGTNMAAGTGLGLTASQLGTAGLVQGGLGLLGGLVGGNTVADAQRQTAAQQAALAEKTLSMGKFNPIGTTTTFGTSNFQVDPVTGQLTSAGYQLSPQLQAAQNTLMGGLGTNLQDTARIQAMGRQYMAQSPQEQAAQYMANQQALLAPSREQQSANLMNQLSNTGRTGLSVAQGGNLGMANPEYQALANARAMQDLQLAANATQAGQQQYQFGQGLLSSAYDPYKAGLSTASATEQLGQQPFGLSVDLANASSVAGARQASNYANAMGSSIASQQAANSYNPWATALQGAASNPATSQSLVKLWS
jgi:hypothetical protein